MHAPNGPPRGSASKNSPSRLVPPLPQFDPRQSPWRLCFERPVDSDAIAPAATQGGPRHIAAVPRQPVVAALPLQADLVPADARWAHHFQRKTADFVLTWCLAKLPPLRVPVEVCLCPVGFWQHPNIGGMCEPTPAGMSLWMPAVGKHASLTDHSGEHLTRGLHPRRWAEIFIHELTHAVQLGGTDDALSAARGVDRASLHGCSFEIAARQVAKALWHSDIPASADTKRFPQGCGGAADAFLDEIATAMDEFAAPRAMRPPTYRKWLTIPTIYSDRMDPHLVALGEAIRIGGRT